MALCAWSASCLDERGACIDGEGGGRSVESDRAPSRGIAGRCCGDLTASLGATAMAESLTVTDDLSLEVLVFLEDRIYEFNVGATGIDDGRWLGVLVRDEDGALVAGLSGTTWGGCCKVRDVWVRADRRGRGMGTRLLDAAEVEARRRGCTQIVLSSHSFQAPEFYRKRGFEVLAVVEDDPRGHQEVYLRKRLSR